MTATHPNLVPLSKADPSLLRHELVKNSGIMIQPDRVADRVLVHCKKHGKHLMVVYDQGVQRDEQGNWSYDPAGKFIALWTPSSARVPFAAEVTEFESFITLGCSTCGPDVPLGVGRPSLDKALAAARNSGRRETIRAVRMTSK